MPFFRYQCRKCGAEFKVLQHSNDKMATCLECDSKSLEQLLPRIGVIYKGSGYHSTDYKTTRARGAGSSSADDKQSSNENSASE
jgi:putative FmdB family regulatory protein